MRNESDVFSLENQSFSFSEVKLVIYKHSSVLEIETFWLLVSVLTVVIIPKGLLNFEYFKFRGKTIDNRI